MNEIFCANSVRFGSEKGEHRQKQKNGVCAKVGVAMEIFPNPIFCYSSCVLFMLCVFSFFHKIFSREIYFMNHGLIEWTDLLFGVSWRIIFFNQLETSKFFTRSHRKSILFSFFSSL